MKVWLISFVIIALGSSICAAGDDDQEGRKILLSYSVHSQVKRDLAGDIFGDAVGAALGFLSDELFGDVASSDDFEESADGSRSAGEETASFSHLSTESSSSEESSKTEEEDDTDNEEEDFSSGEEDSREVGGVIERFTTINNFYIVIQPAVRLPSLEELLSYIQSNFPELQSALGLQQPEIGVSGNLDSGSGSGEGGSGEESVERNSKDRIPPRIQYGCGRLSNDVIRSGEEFKPIDIKDIDVVKLSQVLKADVDAGLDVFQLVDHVLQIIEEDTQNNGWISTSGGTNNSNSRGNQDRKLAPEVVIPIIPPPPAQAEGNLPKIIFQDDNLIEAPGTNQLNREYFEKEEHVIGQVEKQKENPVIGADSDGGLSYTSDDAVIVDEASKEYQNFVNVVEVLHKQDSRAEVKAFMVGTIISLGFGVCLMTLWKLMKAKRRELSSGKDEKCSFA